MNEKLVNTLRSCASNPAPCKSCHLFTDDSCTDTLLRQAAGTIEELSEFRERMNHIFAVQYLFYYSEHVVQERVAYFNDTEIQEDEVGRVIHDDFYDSRVVVMPRVQAEKVFGYKWIEKEMPTNNEGA